LLIAGHKAATMYDVILNYKELKQVTKFTDPFIHDVWKEEEILLHYKQGTLQKPLLIKNDNIYLIFNGNHRILVAINNKLTITCKILENLDDVLIAQKVEGEDRDISGINPLTFENIVTELIVSAEKLSSQNPTAYIMDY